VLDRPVEVPEKLLFLFDPARYKVVHGGRGGAKSWGIARALLGLGYSKPLRILCAREIQRSIADSVHRLLCDQLVAMGLDGFYTPQQLTIRGANGTEFLFAGLRQQDVHKIKSFEGADICWVEEAQAVSERSWSILTPTIRKPGSEIWVSFNPELATDPSYQRFVVSPPAGAVVKEISYADNPWLTAELESERADLERRDPVAYRNVWLGEPRTEVEGAIYATELAAVRDSKRIGSIPHDPLLRVRTYWDLGVGDDTAIWFAQVLRNEVRLIGYYAASGLPFSHYAQVCQAKGYTYDRHVLPHDAAARELGTGRSIQEIAGELLSGDLKIGPRLSVEDRINAARMVFPRCWFDKEQTADGITALSHYRRDFSDRLMGLTKPLHDWASHGADAFGYMALDIEDETEKRSVTKRANVRGGWMAS
jgi:phage terminase large subunit